ncbi:S9 family peptidase [Xanthobacter dioxanivorans]|uniref:S9 family peptidase n=1 Tax=Xanthobacter dioxanivorans TaxID=2528964 RepID=A0A974PSC8_9HYPH|nr:S9 family peptidase [Xanthobacter dioxanivorans]QRG08893.1 S9 family peptidase [Xanthobacter dioxanivorans]
MAPEPPRAPRRPSSRTVHAVTLADDYAWLRADNWRAVMRDPAVLDADIRAYLEAENAYADDFLAPLGGLKGDLVAEMRGRIKEDDASVPTPDGPFAYYSRHREGGQHPLACRKALPDGPEAVLLDGDREAEGKAYFHFGGWHHSRDHRRLAFSADTSGAELYTIRVRDLGTGADLPDVIEESTGDLLWSADARALYYIRRDAEHRPSKVFRHVLGTDAADDVLVYEEPDKGFFVSLGETQSHAFGLVSCGDHETSEVHLLDLADPDARPRCVAPRTPGVRYEVEHHPDLDGQDSLVILTNADGAEDFKLVTAPTAMPGRAHWRDLVPHQAGRMILSHSVFSGHMARLEREAGLPRIVIRALAGGGEHAIAFDEEAYALGLHPGFAFDTTEVRFTYASMTTPSEVWSYDMASRARVLLKRQEVPSGHDPADYVTRRIFARAADGESVPVSLLYRRDTPLDGVAPLLLYGYGAYGITIPAGFATNRLSLVDRGFVYAIAHVRGGTDKGWRWYADGKLAHKTNTFTDFIAAAEHLVAQGFTRPDRIVAHGGSAGGMLMGAVANLRPDLFAGMVAEVPFVDVLTTMLDDTLPLTPPEWPEWGNPIADADAFRRILAYSPVDNVRPQGYPSIFALAGLTDPRVTYWEPAKWVARLRVADTGGQPILLRTNMDAGHGGAAGRFDRLDEVALVYLFALKTVGLAG